MTVVFAIAVHGARVRWEDSHRIGLEPLPSKVNEPLDPLHILAGAAMVPGTALACTVMVPVAVAGRMSPVVVTV